MTFPPQTLLELTGVSKQYGALRPLRIERLTVTSGEQVALLGLDRPAAEVFVNLVTGATLPDAGAVGVLGGSTADIATGDAWLATLDQFGIVSERGALLESLTIVQNLAMPFTLDIEPPPLAVRDQATGLARELALSDAVLDRRAGELSPAERLRLRVARALALGPSLLILEHPSATLAPRDVKTVARDIRRVAERRGLAGLALTMDREFARAFATRVLTLEGATGRLKPT